MMSLYKRSLASLLCTIISAHVLDIFVLDVEGHVNLFSSAILRLAMYHSETSNC